MTRKVDSSGNVCFPTSPPWLLTTKMRCPSRSTTPTLSYTDLLFDERLIPIEGAAGRHPLVDPGVGVLHAAETAAADDTLELTAD